MSEEDNRASSRPDEPHAAAASSARERFHAREIALVLSHYDIGVINEIREYRRGSRRAAKLKIATEYGEYLLKRRATGRSIDRDRERAAAGHAVQARAAMGGVPVAQLIAMKTGGTLLQSGSRLYELHAWLPGVRYARHAEQARSAGIVLSRMHAAFRDLELLEELPQGGFSDSAGVRAALAVAHERAIERTPASAQRGLHRSIELLSAHMDRIESKLLNKGLPSQRTAICHGDFHPGNTLWAADSLLAVIDFDSVRSESVAAELANAMLQFSVKHRVGEDPRKWQIGLVSENLRGFAEGYRAANPGETKALAALIPWLMLSAIVAEAASPIARDGDFAGIPAEPFLEATVAMMDWIAERTRAISMVLES